MYAEKGGTNPTKDDIVTVHYAGHGDHYIADHPKGLIMNPDIPSVYGVMGDATKEIIVDGSTITLYSVAIHGVVWVKGVADIRVGQKVMPCQKNLKIIAPLFDRNCQNETYEAGNYNILGYVLDVEVSLVNEHRLHPELTQGEVN